MPPLPTSWRTLLAVSALTPALLGAAAATADAAELSGTVIHVVRTESPSVFLATTPATVVRLRGTEKQLQPLTRGRRATIGVEGMRVRRVSAQPGFARTVRLQGVARRRNAGLYWRVGGILDLKSRATDRVLRGTEVLDRAAVADGAGFALTWKLSAANGAVTDATVELPIAGRSATPAPPASAPGLALPAPAPPILMPAPPAPAPIPAPPAPAAPPAPPAPPTPPAPPAPTPTATPAPAPATPGAIRSVAVTGRTSRQIYHAPSKPGYSSWAGAWLGGDDRTLYTSFAQVTGAVNPTTFVGSTLWKDVTITNEVLRSTDGGASWQPLRSDRILGVPHAGSGQATTGLPDGTIIRRINAEDQQAAGVAERGTAYIQRLAPGATRWSVPKYLLDPDRFTYQLTRIQQLSDGRLVATGNYWEVPAGTRSGRVPYDRQGWLLMVSSDGGHTWTRALTEPAEADRVPPNEWDVAELPSGDLLAMMRTRDKVTRTQFRRQAVLRRSGAGWVMQTPQVTPFAHSGHPELITTAEGVVLHIATTGVSWTADGGATWRDLGFRSAGYYPTAVQAADGTITVISHRGADDDYGERDQAILMDRFKLAITR